MKYDSIRLRHSTTLALEAKGKFGETHDAVLRRLLKLAKGRNGRRYMGKVRRAKKSAKTTK